MVVRPVPKQAVDLWQCRTIGDEDVFSVLSPNNSNNGNRAEIVQCDPGVKL